MLEWRLHAYRHWLTLTEPTWSSVHHPPIDYQDIHYYAAPKTQSRTQPKDLSEVDPELLRTYEKLGIPLAGTRGPMAGVAVDAVFDSVSVATTFKDKLESHGHHLLFVFRGGGRNTRTWSGEYFGSVVPYHRQLSSPALNAAVFSDGSFVYVPKGVRCPMELSTYFRINAKQQRPVRTHPDHRR
jgi:Fe-S cluster assembly protein SufB